MRRQLSPWLRESLAADSYDALGVDVWKTADFLDELKATSAIECVYRNLAAESFELVQVVAVWADVKVDEAVGGTEDLRTGLSWLIESAYALCGDCLLYTSPSPRDS